MKPAKTALLLAAAIAAVSCASRPVNIPEYITPIELIQRAQEASDRNRFDQASQYYEAVLERFPNEIDFVCEAEYEIAYILYRQGKFDLAREGFNNLLERYNDPDSALLPQQFKILSLIVLERMDRNENSRRR